MGTININGKTITVADGASVSIVNNQILVNGEPVADDLSGIVTIKWEGGLASLQTDCSVECGDVQGSVSAGGNVKCNDINGNINAGGSVKCRDIGEHVNAGGSVKCNYVNSKPRREI